MPLDPPECCGSPPGHASQYTTPRTGMLAPFDACTLDREYEEGNYRTRGRTIDSRLAPATISLLLAESFGDGHPGTSTLSPTWRSCRVECKQKTAGREQDRSSRVCEPGGFCRAGSTPVGMRRRPARSRQGRRRA